MPLKTVGPAEVGDGGGDTRKDDAVSPPQVNPIFAYSHGWQFAPPPPFEKFMFIYDGLDAK